MKDLLNSESVAKTFDRVIGVIDHPDFGKIEFHYSNEYEKLKDIPSNRGINSGHAERLFKSISEKLLFTLLLVNEKLFTVDGQHRKIAISKANKIMTYAIIKGYGEKEISIYNSNTKNWGYDDFADHYSQKGIWDYIEFRKFKHQFGIGNTMTISLLLGNKSVTNDFVGKKFREGNFKIKNLSQAQKIAKLLTDFNFYPGWNNRQFIIAFLEIYQYKDFNYKRFFESFKNYSFHMVGVGGGTKHYLDAFEKIYNYHRRDKIMIYDHTKFN